MSVLYEDPKRRASLFDDSDESADEGENVNDKTGEPYWIKAPISPIGCDTNEHWSKDPPIPSSNENESDIKGVVKGERAGKTTKQKEWVGTGMRSTARACGMVWDVTGVPIMLLVYRLINANWMYFEKDILSSGISIFSLTLERQLIALPGMAAIAFLSLKIRVFQKGLTEKKYALQYEHLGDCEVLSLLPVLGLLMFVNTLGSISANEYLGAMWVRLADLSTPLLTVYLGHLVGLEAIGLLKVSALVAATGGATLTLVFFSLGAGSGGEGPYPGSSGHWWSSKWWAGLLIIIPTQICYSVLLIGIGVILRGQKRISSVAWMRNQPPRLSLLSKIQIPAILTCSTYFQGSVYTLVTCSIFHKHVWRDFGLNREASEWFELLYGSIFVTCVGWNVLVWAVGQAGPAMVAASVCIEPIAGSILDQFYIKAGHVSVVEWIGGIIAVIALSFLCAVYYFEERATRREFEMYSDYRRPLIPDIERTTSVDEFTFGLEI